MLRREVDRAGRQWVKQPVNLKASQFAFLQGLSREMGVSVSRVTRRVIQQFIDGLDQVAALEPECSNVDPEADLESERWIMQAVNLRSHQIQFLDRLAKEMGVSVSGATRQIIGHFISSIDTEGPTPWASVDQ